jgi:hypothetical protein
MTTQGSEPGVSGNGQHAANTSGQNQSAFLLPNHGENTTSRSAGVERAMQQSLPGYQTVAANAAEYREAPQAVAEQIVPRHHGITDPEFYSSNGWGSPR